VRERRALHRFGAPLQWKIPVVVSLVVVWVSLGRAVGPAWASAADLALLAVAIVVWLALMRTRRS